LVFATLPALRKRRLTVTVSPASMVPLGGAKLSTARKAPAGTMLTKGVATWVVTVALLFEPFGSVCVAVATEVAAIISRAGGVTVIVTTAPSLLDNVPILQVTWLLCSSAVP